MDTRAMAPIIVMHDLTGYENLPGFAGAAISARLHPRIALNSRRNP